MSNIPKSLIQMFSHIPCPSHRLHRPVLWSQPNFVWHLQLFWSSSWGTVDKTELERGRFCSVSTPGLLKLIEGCPPFGVSQTACFTDSLHEPLTGKLLIQQNSWRLTEDGVIIGSWENPFNSTPPDSRNHSYQLRCCSLISIPLYLFS